MTYPDFDFQDEERSYLPAARVLQYLVDYADHYNLHPHIKVHHHVSRIAPVGNSWSVTALELTTQVEHVSMFDAVVICSGPNIIPVYPIVDGIARFSGRQLHSKEYRKASAFEGKRVLIIGLGPSGIDISFYLLPLAKKVIISHNKSSIHGLSFPKNITIKPVVTSMQDKTVYFADGTEEEVDVIIHCTGYTYHYPFLTAECGLIVDQYISPLYRHFINIEHPTMCIIGVPKKCPLQYMVDFQVRAFKNILKGEVKLPPKEVMLAELEQDIQKRSSEGQRKKDYHKMTPALNEEYFRQLSEVGGLEPIPPVILRVFADAFTTAIKDFLNYRNSVYKILDNESFSKISRKTSSVSVKFAAEDHCKIIQESEGLLKNELKLKEINDDINENDEEQVEIEKSNVDESSEVLDEADNEEEEETNEKCEAISDKEILDEIELINNSLNEEISTTVIETVTEEYKLQTIQQQYENTTTTAADREQEDEEEDEVQETKFEKFSVEAVVEVIPANLNENNNKVNIEEQCGPTDEELNKNEINKTKTSLNCATVNISLEENITKPSGGDEIVKIIQTEEGGGFR
ncbi:hypothetical protein O3M35_001398 [Rhynocoris fuscipes]